MKAETNTTAPFQITPSGALEIPNLETHHDFRGEPSLSC